MSWLFRILVVLKMSYVSTKRVGGHALSSHSTVPRIFLTLLNPSMFFKNAHIRHWRGGAMCSRMLGSGDEGLGCLNGY
jgi:hypothetical protein